jgi:hypothetical protein
LCLLGKCSTTWATLKPTYFSFKWKILNTQKYINTHVQTLAFSTSKKLFFRGFFLVVVGFELRSWCFIDGHSTTWGSLKYLFHKHLYTYMYVFTESMKICLYIAFLGFGTIRSKLTGKLLRPWILTSVLICCSPGHHLTICGTVFIKIRR